MTTRITSEYINDLKEDGYSATTMNHINSFLDKFGLSGGGKAWWNSLPIARRIYR